VTRRTRVFTGVAAAAVAAVALSGCGVPVDNGPTALARRGVPFDLLAPSTPATTAPAPRPVTVPVQIFLLSTTGQLVPVTRQVAFPAPLTAILTALVDGPTHAEALAGLQSAVPPQTQVVSASAAGGVATIDLTGTFGQLVGQAQIEAVAQIVFTATGLTGVTAVSFELDGKPVAVPTASGAEVPAASRSQFAVMAPS
jgi:Sporulation and spore germination